MTIQQDINNTLQHAIANKDEKFYIDELKFLKAELQRGKNKEVDDKFAIDILVKIYRSQLFLINNVSENSPEAMEAYSLIANINDFLPENIITELGMNTNTIEKWIINNIDLSKYRNPMNAIGEIKRCLKYVDGHLIQDVLKKLSVK